MSQLDKKTVTGNHTNYLISSHQIPCDHQSDGSWLREKNNSSVTLEIGYFNH